MLHARRVAQNLQSRLRQPGRAPVVPQGLPGVVPQFGVPGKSQLPGKAGIAGIVPPDVVVVASVKSQRGLVAVVLGQVAVGRIKGLQQGFAGGRQGFKPGIRHVLQPVETIK